MKTDPLFRSYEFLVDRTDQAFLKMEKEHPECMRCEPHCSDCCHAVFGLFLIEAAYIRHHFGQLDSRVRQETLLRGKAADRELRKLEERVRRRQDDPQMTGDALARERIKCPLLDERDECVLYPYRPITCRAYGIPTAIHGKARVCGRTAFKRGESYPLFDLDGAYRDLFALSKALLKIAGNEDHDRASLLITVSRAISTPMETLLNVPPGGPDKAG
ncbi:MAG: YkgJ family cysteine cluster protein [Proteobacteria bacterium]|nr:YkgJ family cysteine cluster protein [Pseudomonadota bacterium]